MNRSDPKPTERLLGVLVCLVCLAIGIVVGQLVRTSTAAGELAQRHRVVEELSPLEKDRLQRRYVRFAKMDAAQQQRLRSLHREFSTAKDAGPLRDVMEQYHDWLKRLTPTQRAELLQLTDDPDQRLLRVIAWRPLSAGDSKVLWQWARERIAPRLMAKLSDKYQRFWKDRDVAYLVWQTFYGGRRPAPRELRGAKVSEEDLQDLAERLSDGPRTVLASRPTLEDKHNQLRVWVWQWRWGGERPSAPKTREDELVRFFMSDKLTEKQREQLLSLPLPERNRRLREMYDADRQPEAAKRSGVGRPGPPDRGEARPGGPQPEPGSP